jgi:hypothetical protein
MSLPIGIVQCNKCNFEGVLARRPITLEYVLPSGETLESYRVFAWCSTCEKIRHAEPKFDADALKREIRQIERRPMGYAFRLLGRGQAEKDELKSLKTQLEVATLRKSEPRCLTCGHETVTRMVFGESGKSNITHTCGGQLVLQPDDHNAPRFHVRPEVIRLDVEGHRLDRD